MWAAALLAVMLAGGVGLWNAAAANTIESRFQQLGSQMICTCGCTEGMLTCTTLGCTTKLQEQAELRQRLGAGMSDAQVVQAFVQEYGTVILANPTTQGFNLLAWVLPWVALGLGLALVLWFVKRWRAREAAPAVAATPATQARIQSQVQAEIAAQMEDWER